MTTTQLATRVGFIALIALCSFGARASDAARREVPASELTPVLAPAPGQTRIHIAAFKLDPRPVTNREFLQFVSEQPQWRRDRIARLRADAGYLSHWEAADSLGPNAQPEQPVTRVSWFAARAYCEAVGGRLPDWNEWESASAASEASADARADPAWRAQILNWYARPATDVLQNVGQARPNLFGLYDLHGLIWEWVDDYASLMVSNDSRNQGDPDRLEFCGAGSISAQDRENYPVLMRIAFLSALEGRSSARRLGFRCADPRRASLWLPPGASSPTASPASVASLAPATTASSEASPTSAVEATVAGSGGILPGDSLYQLPIDFETDTGSHVAFSAFRRQPLILTLFYADCTSVCPMLTNQLQNIERRLRSQTRAGIRILMVSLDANHDTPAVLSDFRRRHHIVDSRWTIARTSPDNIRLLAAVLGVRYRQLPDQSFNHSTTIALADRDGVIQERMTGVLSDDSALVKAADSLFQTRTANRRDGDAQRRR
jgi:formylglycine-generating enzyme